MEASTLTPEELAAQALRDRVRSRIRAAENAARHSDRIAATQRDALERIKLLPPHQFHLAPEIAGEALEEVNRT